MAADTVRAWERRYGLPMPERTPGGHRLYSQYDIETIRWLLARQAEGLSISHAVEAWNEQTAAGVDPLARSGSPGSPRPEAAPTEGANLEALQKAWLGACLAYNEWDAEQILNQAFAMHSVEAVTTGVIQWGLHEIGELWYRGEASVQQEHFASALAARRLDALLAATPPPVRVETILLACPPDEWHSFTLLLLSLLLRRRGWNAVYLGANVPMARLEETLQTVQPALVVMAAQQLSSAFTLRDTSLLLAKWGIPLAYGGRIFNQIPELTPRISGDFLGETLGTALDRIRQLVEEPDPDQAEGSHMKQSESLPGSSRFADAYRLDRRLIESSLTQRLSRAGMAAHQLEIANLHFGNTLVAALDLGNVAFIEGDLDWIRNLIPSHGAPAESLRMYLTAFSQEIHERMGRTSAEVVDWLEAYISRM
jgi:DNA-binding transcriptional MerR regulator